MLGLMEFKLINVILFPLLLPLLFHLHPRQLQLPLSFSLFSLFSSDSDFFSLLISLDLQVFHLRLSSYFHFLGGKSFPHTFTFYRASVAAATTSAGKTQN